MDAIVIRQTFASTLTGRWLCMLRFPFSTLGSGYAGLGLNRCLDVGLPGYRRDVGYGVMSYNLHVIGRELLARERARAETVRWAA